MYKLTIIFILLSVIICSQQIKVIESSENYIIISLSNENFSIRDTSINSDLFQYIKQATPSPGAPGAPWLPYHTFQLGIPSEAEPDVQILSDETEQIRNKMILPFPEPDDNSESDVFNIQKDIYGTDKYFPDAAVKNSGVFRMRFATIAGFEVYPFQFDPVQHTLLFHKKMVVKITYKKKSISLLPVKDQFTDKYLQNNVLNFEQAKNWQGRYKSARISKSSSEDFWYNPEKTFWKIYLSKKGVYRVMYEQLLSLGIPVSENLRTNKLELFNNGVPVPIEVIDDGDRIFNQGDYIQFVGGPPVNSPNSRLNIYNTQNVYWFSVQADSSGLFYRRKDAYPDNWLKTYSSSLTTVHYEVDTIYERLGLADDDERDHWFWGKASGQNKQLLDVFSKPFSQPPGIIVDSSIFKLRVNLHGMTSNSGISPDHKAEILLTSQPIGSITWDGQTAATFEGEFDIHNVSIFPDVNNLQVVARADIPPDTYGQTSDEIRVNWFELEYWREHRANGNYFNFIAPPQALGKNRFSVYSWLSNNMKIYNPEKNTLLINIQNTGNEYNEWLFTDSLNSRTEYFCVAEDYFLSPDSIVRNNNSDLRNTSNSADYIIIAHSNFREAASRLEEFRKTHLSGFDNPRIKTVFIQDIYNEFSNGLVDPYAVRNFIKYTVDNWVSPAPSYIVLFGDMSWDYRGLVKGSRKNFIPSIPYHSIRYGQAVSDNMLAAISGDDVIPDLAIGRLSCETPAEANILVDKIINYNTDASKQWKENVLLIGAGESAEDENSFGFNSESTRLEKGYILPSGYSATKVFRYPNRPEDQKYLGERPQIRDAFNKGCVLANFYGHGGGYQWDFVFLNDDIYLLQNENRLPVVLSITCYTAHFDNQDVFGEQFNKVPGKGSIGFWGHTGITFWVYGVDLNNKLFDQIFSKNKYVIGDAILFAKSQYQSTTQYMRDHIALLTYLGDPALELALPQQPDFKVSPSDIIISPDYPQINDTVTVKVKIENLGRAFTGDTVSVELFASLPDTTYSIGINRMKSFGNSDSVSFQWIPSIAGNYTLKIEANEKNIIPEEDHSDNSAENTFAVYNLSEPYVVKPYNGFTAQEGSEIDFLIADIGYYISKQVIYFIEVDTTINFNKPLISSEGIIPDKGFSRWKIKLPEGKYFWRTRLSDNNQYSRWSSLRTFTISSEKHDGYYVSGKQLNLFSLNNVLYSDNSNGLILNTSLLPPKPDKDRFIEDIKTDFPEDVKGLSAITTDGSYIYLAHMAYYGGPGFIYKMGTGYAGTEKGKIYGALSDVKLPIWHQMFYHSDGYIYIPSGDAHRLHRINTTTGDTSSLYIAEGMLNSTSGKVQNGAFYLCSDGIYIYNLSYLDSSGAFKYKLRVFDPNLNWKVVDEINPSGTSYLGFTGFFIADSNCYPYENNVSGFMRRINLKSSNFEEEWMTFDPYQGFYAWTYDWVNDVVYASVFRNSFAPKITKFAGKYKQAHGSIITQEIGPASAWNYLEYNLNSNGSSGFSSNMLEGYNTGLKKWDTLGVNIPDNYQLTGLEPEAYSKLRMMFIMSDSSFGAGEPLKLTSYNVNYIEPADLSSANDEMSYTPDSLLQGLPITLNFRVRNNGYTDSRDAEVSLYLDNNPSPVYKQSVTVPADSFKDFSYQFNTDELFFTHKINLRLKPASPELYTFNNVTEKNFYVSRDSVNPVFRITFDGIEIISGDVVSSRPNIIMTLSDNSPLPLADTSRFYIFHNNEQLSFRNDSLTMTSSPYPNTQAVINWNPALKNGSHTLEILARDASGNYFDTTSYSISFDVNDQNTVKNVYNYPNPFRDETFFTFTLTGNDLPQEFLIKIFTVARRMVREIKVPAAELRFGFNKIYWDGRDQDGNSLANGVYFSKFVVRHRNNLTSVIQKLAKVK